MNDLPAGCGLIDLEVHGDQRGSLIALEGGATLPFPLKRIYYIYGTSEGVSRGYHAHKDLQQLAICVAGACTIVLDDGASRYPVRLDRPDLGLHISSPIWREMHDFSPDCVLLVLASRPYEDADYIRDYDTFAALCQSMETHA